MRFRNSGLYYVFYPSSEYQAFFEFVIRMFIKPARFLPLETMFIMHGEATRKWVLPYLAELCLYR